MKFVDNFKRDIPKKYIYFIKSLFILITFAIPFLLTIRHRIDPFWFIYQIPQILTEYEGGYVSDLVIPGHAIILVIISKICDIPPDVAIFFPVGGIIVPILGYAIYNKIFNIKILSLLITLYFALLMSSSHAYAISPYGLGTILLLTGVFIYINGSINKMCRIIALFVCFAGLHIIYYTSETFLIMFLLYSTLVFIVFGDRIKHRENYLIRNLVLSFIVIFLSFNQMLYKTFIPKFFFEKNVFEVYDRLLSSLPFSNHGIDELYLEPYVYSNPNTSYSHFILLAWIFVIIMPVIINYTRVLKSLMWHKNFKAVQYTFATNLNISISLLIISEIIIYAIRGVLMFRMLLLLGPIIAILSIRNMPLKRWKPVASIVLILLISTSGMYFNLNYSNTKLNKLDGAQNSIDWLYNNVDKMSINMLADDLYTTGLFKTYGVKYNRTDQIYSINSRKYEQIANVDYANNKNPTLRISYKYIILNKKYSDKPLYGFDWILYEPLLDNFIIIDKNVNMNKIYDDNTIWVFKT